jgi:outer membrane receptor for ferrienterochelin and colicins
MANNFQNDFDKGKNRDSNYVYGPSMPLTYFIGLKISSN